MAQRQSRWVPTMMHQWHNDSAGNVGIAHKESNDRLGTQQYIEPVVEAECFDSDTEHISDL